MLPTYQPPVTKGKGRAVNTCTDCGARCYYEVCARCRRRIRRAELAARPIPQHHVTRTDEEQAEAEARVAELRRAAGDRPTLAEEATATLRRHVGGAL